MLFDNVKVGDIVCLCTTPQIRIKLDKFEDYLKDVEVIKVGNKYITIKYGCNQYQFEKDICNSYYLNEKNFYDCSLFLNKESAIEYNNKQKIFYNIVNKFNISTFFSLTMEQINTIITILDNNIEEV